MLKKCTKCEYFLPTGEFGKNKRSSDGLRHWCKPCYATYQKAYRSGEDRGVRKYQPTGNEMINPAADADSRSDTQLAYQNQKRWDERRKNGKPECASPGCYTKINYRQEKYCYKHERILNQRDADIKLLRRY